MASDSDDLPTKVLSWLRTEGYPLEIQVLRHLRSSGFTASQGLYFTDPESGGSREVDVIASFREFSEPWGWDYDVNFVVECKSGVEKPWVAFTDSEFASVPEPHRVVQRFCSQRGFEALREVSLVQSVQSLPLFSLPERSGTSLVRAFKTQADEAYGALTALSKAASAISEDVPEDGPGKPNRARVVFPILVVEAPLFECFEDEDHSLVVREIQEVTICWRRPLAQARLRWPLHFIDVVHIDRLGHYAADRFQGAQALVGAFHNAFGTSRAAWHGS